MPIYMMLFVGLAARPVAVDAETADYNRRWRDWIGGLAARGELLAGGPLAPRGQIVTANTAEEMDIDRVDVGGYLIVRAGSDEQAVALAREAPHMSLGGTTIVRPAIEPPPVPS